MSKKITENYIVSNIAEGNIQTFVIPEVHNKNSICCTLRGIKGVPLSAKRFAKLILAEVSLLESLAKRKTENNQYDSIEWCLTEAAVIGEDVSFVLTSYSKDTVKAAIKKHKKEQRVATASEVNESEARNV